MALFFNGFDFFNGGGTDQLQSVWDAGSAVDTISAVGSGAFGYGRYSQNGFNNLYKSFANVPGAASGNWATLYFAFHWYPGGSFGDDGATWVGFYDGSSAQAYLRITSGGIIKLYRGNGTLLATGVTSIAAGVWNWVAGKITFNGSTGTCTLKLNGVQQFAATGLNTITTANAYATKIGFSRPGNGSGYQGNLDNVHIYDGTDAAPWNDISAERRIYFGLATGDGALTAWTASAGNKWACIDENPPNNITDYIYAATPGDQYTYTKAALSGVGSIDGVQLWMQAQKDDATTRGVKLLSRSNGGTVSKGAENLVLSGWLYYVTQWLLDPSTAAAWTVSNFDSNQFGVEVST